MQQAEGGGDQEATVDVQFTDLPNALIACKVPEDLFNEGGQKVRTACCVSSLLCRVNAEGRLVLFISKIHTALYI